MSDTYKPNPAHVALWRSARTVDELGRLIADWLEGTLPHNPFYADAPDEETGPLVPVLAEANRHGYFTHFSQPGEPIDEDGDGQRAAVSGFCTEQTAAHIEASLLRSELIVTVYPPGSDAPTPIVAGVYGEQRIWVGGAQSPNELTDEFGAALGDAGLGALWQAWQVDIVDPQWGRNSLLWSRLSAVWA